MTSQDHPIHPIENSSMDYWGLTAREHAAIQLRVPDSGTEWLDAMIRQSLRQDQREHVMTGFHEAVSKAVELLNLSPELAPNPNARQVRNILRTALVDYADALLVELAKETK